MKKIMIEMIEIYKPNGVCWMNYKLEKNNPYTFHHIKEIRNGGKGVITNGAILTKNAHMLLNEIGKFDFKIYKNINNLFQKLNNTMEPPTEEYYDIINFYLKKVSPDLVRKYKK